MEVSPEMMEQIKLSAQVELASRYFYDYCQLRHPDHYTEDREFLEDLCTRLQDFVEQNDKRFLVVTIPPRHYKSFTGTNFVEWLLGIDPTSKVMTGSYNETLSTTFARKVRNTIEEKATKGNLVYNDIFPDTKVKYGQASASLWALEGSAQDNYLATSPTGTATGFGANVLFIDDIIKNDKEAYNEATLYKHWTWFTNTMMQRVEGDDWKVIVIMTRWAENDLAGMILSEYDDVEHISYSAVQDDGTMLAPSILNKKDYLIKTKNMNKDIVEANYNQTPIDITGRLYGEFAEHSETPIGAIKNFTDTADKGTDYLCSINYFVKEDQVYITDILFTNEPMEITEPLVAEMLHRGNVNVATFESNNGGRGFARNVKRLLKDNHANTSTVVKDEVQSANKEARILSSSAWVNQNVHMPTGWKQRYGNFFNHIARFMSKGKNEHDDGPDVLASIYEAVTQPNEIRVWM